MKKSDLVKLNMSEQEIDIISYALKTQIAYIQGLLIVEEYKKNPDQKRKDHLRMLLELNIKAQEKTTYDGQAEVLKHAERI